MFCPLCKAEYREGFTHCNDCDVDLVASLVPSDDFTGEAGELAWRGSDAVAFSRVIAAFGQANIPTFVKTSADHLAFGLGIPRPRYDVIVPAKFWHQALELAGGISETLPLGTIWNKDHEPKRAASEDSLSAEADANEKSMEIPEAPDRPEIPAPDDLVEKWDPKKATKEVWAGNEIEVESAIRASLRENGIGNQTRSIDSQARISVYAEQEGRAREIIREVAEGTPPE